jgi:L-amino acid N-acyltransferase YncA
MLATMVIREAEPEDWTAIWSFFQPIASAGETYCYDRDIGSDEARRLWFVSPPGATFVALDERRDVVGSAKMYPNQSGPGSHVASASFMVDPERAGHGVGRALGLYVLDRARSDGYRAMQFNAVVESNARAVALWRSLGFEVLATIPEGFAHPTLGLVGLHVMYRRL